MELIDALCSSEGKRSPVELTLTPAFRRTYSTMYKAIDEFEWEEGQLARVLASYLPRPKRSNFYLLGVDVTPQPRPYAQTLTDRGMVYQPAVVKGNKPVTIGHQYSTVALLPEAEAGLSGSWLAPLMTQRVATAADKALVGAGQIAALLRDNKLPFRHRLCVEVADSGYSKPEYLAANRDHRNLVSIVRVRSNRVLYRQPVAQAGKGKRGHPTWYGEPFRLQDATTWPPPDQCCTLHEVSRRGKHYRVEIQAWNNLLMRGQQHPHPLPMHRYPFTLVRIVRYDDKGQPVSKEPLWLIVIGERRHELSLNEIHQAYGQRFDLEHFFRFSKQKLLLTDFQTPETQREEHWWQLVHIAYAQLWMARHVAALLPRPWERNLPAMRNGRISPTLVQRDFARIIRQLGTPAKPPKHRGNSPGRPWGTRLTPRSRHKVVVKGLLKAASP